MKHSAPGYGLKLQYAIHPHIPEATMQGPTFLIPIFFFLSTGSILAVYLFTRHRERMAMINKGMQSEEICSIYTAALSLFIL